MAIGYLSSKTSAKLLSTRVSLPLVFALSVLPDLDILLPNLLEHRGPTHSLISSFVIFIPFLVVYRKTAAPYLIALIQHSLIGDFIAGGRIQLLWPFTTQHFGTGIGIRSTTNVAIEWATFLIFMVVLLKTKDILQFFKARSSHLLLAIPTFTVLLPTFLSFPMEVPLLLVPPHLVYLGLFTAALVVLVVNPIRPAKRVDMRIKNKIECSFFVHGGGLLPSSNVISSV